MISISIVRLDSPSNVPSTVSSHPLVLTFNEPPSFQTLVKCIQDAVQIDSFKLFYIDDEDDLISITSDVELQSCLIESNSDLRLFFNAAGEKPKKIDSLVVNEVEKTQSNNEVQENTQVQNNQLEKVHDEKSKIVENFCNDFTQLEKLTPDEEFDRDVDLGINNVIVNFKDGDLQAKFIKFFEDAKNWVITLPVELRSWRSNLLLVLEHIAKAVGDWGVVVEILIRTLGWTLETFSATLLDRIRQDLVRMFPTPQTLTQSQIESQPETTESQINVPLTDNSQTAPTEVTQAASTEVTQAASTENTQTATNKDTQTGGVEQPITEDSSLVSPQIQTKVNIPLAANAALQDLETLECMGFCDREENIKLLAKHKGDVIACVEDYLIRGN